MTAKALIIAGSDSGAGAGLQADLKTMTAHRVYATTAITAITAQNTLGVQDIHALPLSIVAAQIQSVLQDMGADVIKTGMLHSEDLMTCVLQACHDFQGLWVIDPVMVAKGGAKLLQDSAVQSLRSKLIPKAHILTPNIPEAEVLCGLNIRTKDEQIHAGRLIQNMGVPYVLMKGGHMPGPFIVDLLIEPKGQITEITHARQASRSTHGTGCTTASAIAANLALGYDTVESCRRAIAYVQKALQQAPNIGQGHGPLGHVEFL